ncbi:MAG: pilus assembly protein [Actinomycetia bacterium]|nr:pilus assembly protein [Actinomycetes bacterium]
MKMKERSERGAALVEMAVILPVFLLMMFGMIEASWAFASANDVRHGAREGARLAAVGAAPFESVDEIGAEVCSRMDIAGGSGVTVTFATPTGDGSRGSEGTIIVSLNYSSLTGSLDSWFGGKVIDSDIDFVIESPITGASTWWDDVGGGGASYSC